MLSQLFLILLSSFLCDAGYGNGNNYEQEIEQSDVEAPAYVPSYMRNQKYLAGGGYSGTKTSGYSGTKTGGYSGTKTGHYGTKSSYSGTKSSYSKSSYSGTKSSHSGTKSSYTGSKSWNSVSGQPQSYDGFKQNYIAPAAYEFVCEPSCQNNGICVGLNTCHCPANYLGPACEYEKKPCLAYPPLPSNSERRCSAETCTIHCRAGHKFPDGATVASLRCLDGQWRPSRTDVTSLSDCVPECAPPCLNGGACLSRDVCQCPEDYRGPQCQYSTDACDFRKLAFNGAYRCEGDSDRLTCSVSCPPGARYSSPAAQAYTCLYAEGVFLPQPLPHCVFQENVIVVTPSNYGSGNTKISYENLEIVNEVAHTSHDHRSSANQVIVIEETKPKEGTCLTWAGAHYKTFDGNIFSAQSDCRLVLARDTRDHRFTVAVRHRDCAGRSRCPSELVIFVEDREYVLAVQEDGSVLFRSSHRQLPVPAELPGLRVAQPNDVIVTLDAGATVTWDTNNVVMVSASVALWNNTEGLCGNLDGIGADDYKMKDNAITRSETAFLESWEMHNIGETCGSKPADLTSQCSTEQMKKAKQFCIDIFKNSKFRKCHTVMDFKLTSLIDTCMWDYCSCSEKPEECACSTVSVYARECLRRGISEIRSWRDEQTCPMRCPEGKLYRSCGPNTQLTCSSALSVAKVDPNTCVEGCFCPEGLLLEGGRCIAKTECPCRLRSRSFKPGAVVHKECNTCTCQSGQWTCTQSPCGARCGAYGDPHYTTFDGLKYDFMGHCTYLMLSTDNLTVEVENVACSGAISEQMNLAVSSGAGEPSCTKSVNLNYGGASVHFKQGGFIIVNGKEVASLPVYAGEVLIRAASSLFIIVQIPNGVDLWWDGNTRVFVDVPPSFMGLTKGLCGTFNLNQRDDFLTPEGDIEQTALAFANKWKTREVCSDTVLTEPEHPCKANVEKKAEAEKYCAKLKSKLFEDCHWHVDVESFYAACLYDLCACEQDIGRCLCPVLGDYAGECARARVHVQWRPQVKECELSCTGGQEYTVCADSCLRTCADVTLSGKRKCKPCCVEGCACPIGQVLDATQTCVPVSLCPCWHNGMEFQPGYKETRAGKRDRELCTCVGAHWACSPATPDQIRQYPPAEDMRHNCSAAQHMEFTTCETADPPTCKNMHIPPSSTTAECRPGCQCKKGYVLDMSSKKCILPTECPCHHGGRSYPDGHTMQEECNTCTCVHGAWSCTRHACAGACAAWGDSHVVTFDGTTVDFEGVCTYLLAKGSVEAGGDFWSVEMQNVPCGTTGATCSKSVTLRVTYAGVGETVSLTRHAPAPRPDEYKKIKFRHAGIFLFLDVPSLGVTLQWDGATRLYVKVDAMWQNRVKGLCGNYNGDMRDDLQTPSGGGMAEASALIFADSWKLKATCPKPTEVRDHCEQRPSRKDWAQSTCNVLKQPPFTLCHAEVPVSGWLERCTRDACACDAGGDCECACAAIAAYAQECARRGVCVKWRTKELCPMQCDENCSQYDPCMSACPVETCENTLNYEEIRTTCEKDTLVEGCQRKDSCANGTVYSNSNYTECVPRAKCRPACMTLGGRDLLEGEVIVQDACHTCWCSKGASVCNGQPCATDESPKPVPLSSLTTPKPKDEALKCVTGWTPWVNRGTPENTILYNSVETEPLPHMKDLQIGSPMCKKQMMRKIECRTVTDHKSAKETGLNAECSLEKGLLCEEINSTCPDFEIRVYCECDAEPFQCLNSTHPNHPHPTDCAKFYECTPEESPNMFHAVLKSCPGSLLYNPVAMVCDWPASVIPLRPECDEKTGKNSDTTSTTASPTTKVVSKVTQPPTPATTSPCPAGQVYKACAYACDKLCHHFTAKLRDEGKCQHGQKCVEGCVDEAVANIKCDVGSLWRDANTCVPLKDCTCMSKNGTIQKPGSVSTDGCVKCQCLDNALYCDSSACVQVVTPNSGVTHQPIIQTVSPTAATILLLNTTVNGPPECDHDRFESLLWSGAPLPQSSFTASSMDNAFFSPHFARLDGSATSTDGGSWTAGTHDKNQYLQVELPRREPVYSVVLQGSPLFDSYVTSYEVLYGDDGHVFSAVKGPDGKNKVFRGPKDKDTPVEQTLQSPFEAKFVRIRPLTWHNEIAVRFDLRGCPELTTTSTTTPRTTTTTGKPVPIIQCDDPLGIEAGLPIDNVEVSSNPEGRQLLSFNSDKGWTPLYSTPGEWIMFDFTSPRNITGIKTKGGAAGWVTSYSIMYTSDLTNFSPIVDGAGSVVAYLGNFDRESVVAHEFRPPIHARYLKLIPKEWKDKIEIRIQPVGCFLPYPIITPAPPTAPAPPPACPLCPGVQQASGQPCCSEPTHYDGENCVPREQCPCFSGFISYAVGAKFRSENCTECVCKLGGVTHCSPASKCECPSDQVSVPATDCECACQPCPAGTRICPTSHLCLSLDKWCDGLQDCPDDERDCVTKATTLEPLVVTTVAPTVGVVATTVAPKPACPKVECPGGYKVSYTTLGTSQQRYRVRPGSELPPPRPRLTYSRYLGTKTGVKGGRAVAKGGYSKGGYSPVPAPSTNQAFSLAKPLPPLHSTKEKETDACRQFRCVPSLPPPPRPGKRPEPLVCSAPQCPKGYSLKLEVSKDQCPQYSCVPPVERPVYCNMTGRTFTTFDGLEYKFDVCFHMLARENTVGLWSVMIRKKCRLEGCRNELLVHQDDQLILVKPELMIEYDNYEYTVEQTTKICFQKNSFDLSRLGDGLVIKSRKYNFTVIFSADGDVKVGVYKSQMGRVDGLCGYFDGSAANDRRLPDGSQSRSTEAFAESWAKPGHGARECAARTASRERQKKAHGLCDAIAKDPLSRCGKVLSIDKWRHICLEKLCDCAEQIVNGTRLTLERCRCTLLDKFVAECLAGDKDLDLGQWRMSNDCPANCPAPLVHYDCYSRECEPACAGAQRCAARDGLCVAGCHCPEGTLRDKDSCVAPADCRDCTCSASGTKYSTFESDNLPLGGNCTYLVSRDRNDTGHAYEIYATNGPCEGQGGQICTKTVHLLYGKNVVSVERIAPTNKVQAIINGEVVYKYPLKKDRIQITSLKEQGVIVGLPVAHVELEVIQSNNELKFEVRVPSHIYAGNTEGLCGVCAGYAGLVTSNGTETDDVDEYGRSWQAKGAILKTLDISDQDKCGAPAKTQECVPPPPEDNPCNNLLNAEKFGPCHALVDPHSYIESCLEERCHSNTSNACATLERYAAECRRQGVCLKWRSADLCPSHCESPFVYRPCVGCEKTCSNMQELGDTGCDSLALLEGCYCPEGKVRMNNTCIEPSKCFPCLEYPGRYLGDEWEESACVRCSCAQSVQVACTTQTCGDMVCSTDEDLVKSLAKPGQCCRDQRCVPKPHANCEEPKMIECGHGQVLKQRETTNGCKEFACECKPASECEPLPSANEVEPLEPGMQRNIDETGCCPRAVVRCEPSLCPAPPACPPYHKLVTETGDRCCPTHRCEVRKDKCIVTLEWEAASKGGERARGKPETMLKEIDEAWLDGPCRNCRCVSARPLPPTQRCDVTSCPALVSQRFVLEPRPVPFACCPEAVPRACRNGDAIYKVGDKWPSKSNVCESYKCVQTDDDRLNVVTDVQTCDRSCQPGWKYIPPADATVCCGRCVPVACVSADQRHDIGTTWTSADHCVNYTCVEHNGTLQVQSSNTSCPEVSADLKKLFVFKETKVEGQCCKKMERIACRVGNLIYQEGQTWPSPDPCKNVTCARDSSQQLSHVQSLETCARACGPAHQYVEVGGACCGRCEQTHCLVEGDIKEPDTTWHSPDNCTVFTCSHAPGAGGLLVSSSTETCPDISRCRPEDIVTGGCCPKCKERPLNLKEQPCKLVELSEEKTRKIVRIRRKRAGLCTNELGFTGLYECRGSCFSGSLYNNSTGIHDTSCSCCQPAGALRGLDVTLTCADGSTVVHRLETPAACDCRGCGEGQFDSDTIDIDKRSRFQDTEPAL